MTTSGPAGFCTQCGAPRASGANFCTGCGAPLAAGPAAPAGAGAAPARGISPAAVGVVVLLLAAGGASAYFALRESQAPVRAVSGAPGMPVAAAQSAGKDAPLPPSHPNIEMPKEVLAFLDELTAAADKAPNDVEALLRLTRARYRASVLNPTYQKPAQQALDRLLALDPENEEGMRIAANLAYDQGNFVEAEQRFRRFLAKHPDDPSALTDLGSALLFQDRPDDAMGEYRRALEKDPNFLQARFNLGITLQKRGKSEEALVELKKAAELAQAPEQKQHIENAIAEVEGREPVQIAKPEGAMPADHPPIGAPGAGAAAAAPAAGGGHTPKTNATSDFQREAESLLTTHPIVGPRVREFQWSGAASGRVLIGDFPMDKMPPVVRNKFKSGMNQKLTALAAGKGVSEAVSIELVDPATGAAMDRLDGKEMVGAFDPQQ